MDTSTGADNLPGLPVIHLPTEYRHIDHRLKKSLKSPIDLHLARFKAKAVKNYTRQCPLREATKFTLQFFNYRYFRKTRGKAWQKSKWVIVSHHGTWWRRWRVLLRWWRTWHGPWTPRPWPRYDRPPRTPFHSRPANKPTIHISIHQAIQSIIAVDPDPHGSGTFT